MDSTVVTAGAAVMGSLVGALASLGSTWFTQRYQGRRDRLSRQIARREALYADFIAEAARLASDALVHTLDDPQAMAPLWGLLSRMRLSGSPPVLAAAEAVAHAVVEQYLAPNLTTADIHALARKGDPLKAFGEACRAELDAIDPTR